LPLRRFVQQAVLRQHASREWFQELIAQAHGESRGSGVVSIWRSPQWRVLRALLCLKALGLSSFERPSRKTSCFILIRPDTDLAARGPIIVSIVS
jgi:hypothetical protein